MQNLHEGSTHRQMMYAYSTCAQHPLYVRYMNNVLENYPACKVLRT